MASRGFRLNWVAVSIALLALAGTLGYFYLAGEDVKRSVEEEGAAFGERAPIVSLVILTVYFRHFEQNPQAIDRESGRICTESGAECAERFSPNESARQACKNAAGLITIYARNIKNENSVLLGFNSVALKFSGANCNIGGPAENGFYVQGFPIYAGPYRGLSEKEDWECNLPAYLRNYGAVEAAKGFAACLQELENAQQ
ncbi:MAG: hypothetical protein V1676_01180 [Candidatus Diapherotrites archaeon]